MEFKDKYEEWIERNGGLNSAVKNSYDTLNGGKKSGSITTQNIASPFFKRGALVLFDYVDLDLIRRVTVGYDVPFFDGRPFILALEHDKQYQYGLNLNVLPMNARIALFEMLYKVYWNDIEFNTGKEYNKWHEFKRIDSTNMARLLKLKSGIAINKYDVSIINKPSVIEWESAVPASTLYMKHNIIFNKKKNLNLQTLWKLVI